MPVGEIVVDVVSPEGGVVPSGAADPPECRFKNIGPALSYASGVWQPANAGAPVTVRAVGAPTPEAPVVFEGEPFPLVIGSGVTLTTAASASDPSLWIIAADPPSAAVNVVEMLSGAALEGFTVRSVSASMSGVVATCGVETVPVTLTAVRVEGSGVLQHGLTVTGTCGIEGTAVHVDGAAKAGVLVNTASPVGVTLTGGSIRNSGESGVELLGGAVALAGNGTPFDVHSNVRHGIRVAPAQPNPRAVTLSLALGDVHDNGEAGILVKELGGSSSVSITSSLIRKNTGKSPLSVYGTGRIAGGMLLWGDAPQSFVFHGNTICGNATDQIGVFSDDEWPLAAPDCGTSNVFAAPGAGYYVYSTTELPAVEVPAQNNRWAPNPPTGLVVKTNVAPSCGVATPLPACN
jgi:hypothetical protein